MKEAILLDMEKKTVIYNKFFETGKDDENLNMLSDYLIEQVEYFVKLEIINDFFRYLC